MARTSASLTWIWKAFYRGGSSAQLLLQPRLLGLLQLGAGQGIEEELRVENQAEDSAHLREQHTHFLARCVSLAIHLAGW